MPIYLYWGEDDFAIAKAVDQLQQRVDPNWLQFNYQKLLGDRNETIIEGLNQAITPVFGMGERLTWLEDTNICQQCSTETLDELERTLSIIPENSHLLLTTTKKPDGRLKSTKLIKKHAVVKEFSLIPPWKIELIERKVKDFAKEIGIKLTPQAIKLLADSVGNNTRQLWNELEKLQIYQGEKSAIDADLVSELVVCYTQNSLKLAAAIKDGKGETALELVTGLINLNEPALRIVATLIGQFRTWTIVKLMQETGETDDRAIASAADINNPNRLYYIRQEIARVSAEQFITALPVLLELEYSLKRGAEPMTTLQTKAIELACLFQ